MTVANRSRQAGVTALGFLILASIFGVLGLATMKITPLYLQNMKLSTILDDVEQELSQSGSTPAGIRNSLNKRLTLEGIRLPAEDVSINAVRDGYQVRVQYENRTPFFADIWFLVVFDKQIEIQR